MLKGKFKPWAVDKNIYKSEIAYIGDDINDLRAMKLCGYIGCPSNSTAELKSLWHK
jgi:3-deoxy-D-manno-octulosonate 8-phosphate phosphatase (KDO 8-P phosphatase)